MNFILDYYIPVQHKEMSLDTIITDVERMAGTRNDDVHRNMMIHNNRKLM